MSGVLENRRQSCHGNKDIEIANNAMLMCQNALVNIDNFFKEIISD